VVVGDDEQISPSAIGTGCSRVDELIRTQARSRGVRETRAAVRRRVRLPGRERDVIFLSVVADDNRGAFTSRTYGQRVNVAASRARDQMWVFHSVGPGSLRIDLDVRGGGRKLAIEPAGSRGPLPSHRSHLMITPTRSPSDKRSKRCRAHGAIERDHPTSGTG
jgi:hypothetical protein